MKVGLIFMLLAAQLAQGLPARPQGPYCPVEDFEASGGALLGSWVLRSQCPDVGQELPCEFPFDNVPACQGIENTVRCQWDGSGVVTFSNRLMRIRRLDAIVARYTLSKDCTAAVRPEAGPAEARCRALSRPPLMSCTMDQELCICDSRVVDEPRDEALPYQVTGNRLQFADFQAIYAVRGDRLVLEFDPHPLSWKYWVLEKAPLHAR